MSLETRVKSPEILSHVARILQSGEVHRETNLMSVCNISRSLNHRETKQAEWMRNMPRSSNDDETKQAAYQAYV